MLDQAAQEITSFKRGTKEEVNAVIADSKHMVIKLEPVLASIRKRRNEWLAHLDPATVTDPKALAAQAKLTIPDLEEAFTETENMLIKLACFYDGTFGELKFIGGDDYETALDWIRKAKCAGLRNTKRNLEREVGRGLDRRIVLTRNLTCFNRVKNKTSQNNSLSKAEAHLLIPWCPVRDFCPFQPHLV